MEQQLSFENNKFVNKNIFNYDVQISDLKQLNPNLTLAKCRIFYIGDNRNRSNISFECAEEMAKQISYIPVVGEWKENINNFGGHGGKIEISDKGIEFIDTTKAYGCVVDEPVWYEDVVEEDGTTSKYMCCHLVLFTGKYPELSKVIESGSYQSMEISVEDGEQKDNVYYIKKATFMALCILGKDDVVQSNTTEPCFESSTIEKVEEYKYIKNEFKQNFSLIMNDLIKSFSLNNQNIKVKEGEGMSLDNTIDTTVVPEDVTPVEEFALTMEQLEAEIERKLKDIKYEEEWYGEEYECQRYYLRDYDENFAYCYDNKNDIYVKIPYSKSNDDVIIEAENATRVKVAFVDWEGGITTEPVEGEEDDDMGEFSLVRDFFISRFNDKVEAISKEKEEEFNTKLAEKDCELNSLNEKFTAIQETVNSLESYKLQKENEEKLEVIAEFAEELSDEEVKSFKAKIGDYSDISKLRDDLLLAYAKKNHKPKANQPKYSAMGIENFNLNVNNENTVADNVWDRLKNKINK